MFICLNMLPQVRVLFMNPTHKSMIPCPYFLDSKCRFADDACRSVYATANTYI